MQLSVRLPIYDPAVFNSHQEDVSEAPMTPNSVNSMNGWPSMPSINVSNPDRPKPGKMPRTSEEEFNTTWEMWDVIRFICDNNPRLTLSQFLFNIVGYSN